MRLLLLAAVFQSASPTAVHYRCLDESRFTLIASAKLAIVGFSDREYRLPRQASALAIKYASKDATLYLDDNFAAFVADDRPLPGCFKEEPANDPKTLRR